VANGAAVGSGWPRKEILNFVPLRLLAHCLMPNHWHLVLQPRADGDLSKFLQRVTMTHTQRYHAKGQTVGYGHIYQGRYKSLPVEMGGPFMALVRYVERNAKRAGLAPRAEDWPWSSVHERLFGKAEEKQMLSPWPVPEPPGYLKWLNHSLGKGNSRKSAQREGPPLPHVRHGKGTVRDLRGGLADVCASAQPQCALICRGRASASVVA